MSNLAEISLKERVTELRKSIRNVEKSFDLLKNKESNYANEHLILIEAYGGALRSFESGLEQCT